MLIFSIILNVKSKDREYLIRFCSYNTKNEPNTFLHACVQQRLWFNNSKKIKSNLSIDYYFSLM